MIYLKLFYEFFMIGLFTVGGGLATIPYLKDLAERTGWFEVSFITDMIAISESTPGPIGINMATYVGYEVAGALGGIIASISEIIPSIIIVALVSRFLHSFKNNKNINYAFYGIRPSVTALIAVAGLEVLYIAIVKTDSIANSLIGLIASIDLIKVLLFVVVFYLIRKSNKHPVFYIVISGLVGTILKFN